MSSERSLWHTMRRNLAPYWIPQRIEDKSSSGIPDVYYAMRGRPDACGWVELKHVHRLPARGQTPLRVPGFTPVQRAWFMRFIPLVPRLFLFLQVERLYFLLRGSTALLVGEMTSDRLGEMAAGRWEGRVDWPAFAEIIASPGPGPGPSPA